MQKEIRDLDPTRSNIIRATAILQGTARCEIPMIWYDISRNSIQTYSLSGNGKGYIQIARLFMMRSGPGIGHATRPCI